MFILHGPVWTLEPFNRGIGIQSEKEDVALIPCMLQQGYMAGVQQVKAAIGKDHRTSCVAILLCDARGFFMGDDFLGAGVALTFLKGFHEFRAAQGCRAEFSAYCTGRDVGKLDVAVQGQVAGCRHGKKSDHRVAGARDIRHLQDFTLVANKIGGPRR